jgi:hypothetical protein
MAREFRVFVEALGRTISFAPDQVRTIERRGSTVYCQLQDGTRLTIGPFESEARAEQVENDVMSAFERAQDTRPTPATREEYLQGIRDEPWGFPYVGGDSDLPPAEWVAEAWDLDEVQESVVDGGIVRDVGKLGQLWCSRELLEVLDRSLRTEQVVGLFLAIRRSNPHREAEFRPGFERAFARHAHALPPPLGGSAARAALSGGEGPRQAPPPPQGPPPPEDDWPPPDGEEIPY